MRGYTLDAGAFIALERRDTFMASILFRALTGGLALSIPQTVIAQIWRGGSGKQANCARLIKAGRAGVETVIIDDLTDDRARQIGVTIGQTSHSDIADVHVALVAAEQGHAVLTSDDGDIAAVDPHLTIVHV
ncbi:MAG: PIN domain nuclease [Streptosporangiales bacterium]|nr:PIN domain nuclease [Streptosporangiales bacterium]